MSKMKLFNFIWSFVFICVANSAVASQVFAQSSYVLPYPSAMPGSIWYKLNLVQEEIERFWYFGDFGSFTYSLKQSDKYLVEAKILFEYKQYLLGHQALLKSDAYWMQMQPSLVEASNHGKYIKEKEELYKSAAEKHIEVLHKILYEVPEKFIWTPEKVAATHLNLKTSLDKSITIRKRVL